eukprot:8147369-Pyramimonas_sp.AAC.1
MEFTGPTIWACHAEHLPEGVEDVVVVRLCCCLGMVWRGCAQWVVEAWDGAENKAWATRLVEKGAAVGC